MSGDKGKREGENAVINEAAAALADRFKADGREVDAVVVVVLFKLRGDQRDFHIGQTIEVEGEVNGEAAADELFCECAGRLNMEATKVARKYRSRRKT
jgi:hypothetical protein